MEHIKKTIKESVARLFEEVEVVCKMCNVLKKTLRCNPYCLDCMKKMKQEEDMKAAIDLLKRQRIPNRYWDFKLDQQYRKHIKESLIIYGVKGTGKTHLCAQLLKEGGGVFYTAIEITDMLQDNVNSIYQFKEMRFLCIDDLNKINPTEFRLEKLFEIIDARYRERKLTILTIDCPPDKIVNHFGRFGEPLVSRIQEWMQKIHLEKIYR